MLQHVWKEARERIGRKKEEEEKRYLSNKLHSLVNRLEKEERKLYREVKKKRIDREEKNQKSEKKRIEKENFIRKFYPT